MSMKPLSDIRRAFAAVEVVAGSVIVAADGARRAIGRVVGEMVVLNEVGEKTIAQIASAAGTEKDNQKAPSGGADADADDAAQRRGPRRGAAASLDISDSLRATDALRG